MGTTTTITHGQIKWNHQFYAPAPGQLLSRFDPFARHHLRRWQAFDLFEGNSRFNIFVPRINILYVCMYIYIYMQVKYIIIIYIYIYNYIHKYTVSTLSGFGYMILYAVCPKCLSKLFQILIVPFRNLCVCYLTHFMIFNINPFILEQPFQMIGGTEHPSLTPRSATRPPPSSHPVASTEASSEGGSEIPLAH